MCKGGGVWVIGGEEASDRLNTCRKVPLQVIFLEQYLALHSISLIFLRFNATGPIYFVFCRLYLSSRSVGLLVFNPLCFKVSGRPNRSWKQILHGRWEKISFNLLTWIEEPGFISPSVNKLSSWLYACREAARPSPLHQSRWRGTSSCWCSSAPSWTPSWRISYSPGWASHSSSHCLLSPCR